MKLFCYILAITVLVANLISCGLNNGGRLQVISSSVPYDKASAHRMLQPGPNVIVGNALLRTQGGEVRTCAGELVRLIPATAYVDDVMRQVFGETEHGYRSLGTGRSLQLPQPNPAYDDVRSTRCNSNGMFVFTNVADGTFYVMTDVKWNVSQYGTQGGMLLEKVRVAGGKKVEIVMTR